MRPFAEHKTPQKHHLRLCFFPALSFGSRMESVFQGGPPGPAIRGWRGRIKLNKSWLGTPSPYRMPHWRTIRTEYSPETSYKPRLQPHVSMQNAEYRAVTVILWAKKYPPVTKCLLIKYHGNFLIFPVLSQTRRSQGLSAPQTTS